MFYNYPNLVDCELFESLYEDMESLNENEENENEKEDN
jgi:hypothetical protein